MINEAKFKERFEKIKEVFDVLLPIPQIRDFSLFAYGIIFSIIAYTCLKYTRINIYDTDYNSVLDYFIIDPSFFSIVLLFVMAYSIMIMDTKLSSISGVYKVPAIFIGVNYLALGVGYTHNSIGIMFDILVNMVIISLVVRAVYFIITKAIKYSKKYGVNQGNDAVGGKN